MENIRKFSIAAIDDFENVLDRFVLDNVEAPKNLGFEMEFTTLESRLTTYFTSARERKLNTELTINFLGGYAYQRVNAFKAFCQKWMKARTILEYDDTTVIKCWEGKVLKLGLEEKTEWGGLVCPIVFQPATPKYINRKNAIIIRYINGGKRYPLNYPYSYGTIEVINNRIENDYFDEIPIRAIFHGPVVNPYLFLSTENGELYSRIRFNNLIVGTGERLVIDSMSQKVLIYRNGVYLNAYDYLHKSPEYDSFAFAKANAVTIVSTNLDPTQAGYLEADYRQHIF